MSRSTTQRAAYICCSRTRTGLLSTRRAYFCICFLFCCCHYQSSKPEVEYVSCDLSHTDRSFSLRGKVVEADPSFYGPFRFSFTRAQQLCRLLVFSTTAVVAPASKDYVCFSYEYVFVSFFFFRCPVTFFSGRPSYKMPPRRKGTFFCCCLVFVWGRGQR